ncbi:hypothetical protein DPMN_032911 [Dreissena polymorpha]|uniref:Uncharacterized protein n=1 Tax=Dreissena polymorpha TaxID=45954 RepID=A0A9D4M608_DREPO|nr:hypothetical protein DPMN_032911 [Dreissena polymorpha]
MAETVCESMKRQLCVDIAISPEQAGTFSSYFPLVMAEIACESIKRQLCVKIAAKSICKLVSPRKMHKHIA